MSEQSLSCEEVVERIFDYLDRELDDETRARIERHLDHCRDCFSRAEFEEKLRCKVRAAGSTQAPERLRQRVREMIEKF